TGGRSTSAADQADNTQALRLTLARPSIPGSVGRHRQPGRAASRCKGKGRAMETIINLIIQLISGAVAGNTAGAALKDYNLGNLGTTIAGGTGGVGGGQILQARVPAIASAAAGGDLDLGAIVGQIVGGGAGGAILTIIAGLVKNMMASQQTR